jgi:CRP-like cAMP-binding protein
MVKTVFKRGSDRRPGVDDFSVEVPAGEYLFREGDLGTEMYILQEGRVEIVKTVDGEEHQLAVLEKGDFFGEMSVLEELPRTASARTLATSRLLQINGSTFDQMLHDNPEIAVRMMRKLSSRLRQTESLLQDVLGRTVLRAHEAPGTPAADTQKPPASQRLFHNDTGIELFLASGSESTVGRHDPVTGINPDIDLSEVDSSRSTSRRHAKIHRRGGRFFLTEEIGTTNGTFVNGIRLETGVPCELKAGDEVQFGLVRMEFRTD